MRSTWTNKLAIMAALLMAGCGSGLPNSAQSVLFCPSGYSYLPAQTIAGNQVTPAGCIAGNAIIVHGLVTDATTAEPIQNANVTVHPMGHLVQDGNGVLVVDSNNVSDMTVKTDATGYYAVHGVLTTESVVVTVTAQNYLWGSTSTSVTTAGPGAAVVALASVSLQPGRTLQPVSGIVYAGPSYAANATVQLTLSNGGVVASTTADTTGHFSFPSVVDVISQNYYIRALPYDFNGDGVYDFTMAPTLLVGTPSSQSFSLDSLVVTLAPVTKQLAYANIQGFTTISAGSNGAYGSASSWHLYDNSKPLVLQFTQALLPSTFIVELRPFENGGSRFGSPVAITAPTFSNNNTTITIAPSAPLNADNDTTTGYELRILSAQFVDGAFFVTNASPANYVALDFDVGTTPTLLPSVQPSALLANLSDTVQTASQLTCDSLWCWVLDANGFFNNSGNYQTPQSAGFVSQRTAWNSSSGFQFQFPSVVGAASYNIYARNVTNTHYGHDVSDWYPVGTANGTSVVEPATGNVYTSTALSNSYVSNHWATFNSGSAFGPLAFGNQIQIAATAVNVMGYESYIDTTQVLTLKDNFAPLLDSISTDTSNSGTQVLSNEVGSVNVKKVMQLNFSEGLSAANSSNLSVSLKSGFATLSPTQPPAQFGAQGTPAQVSTSAYVGPLNFNLRGACTPITCTTGPADSRTCVSNPNIFSAGDRAFAINMGASLVFSNPLNVLSVNGNNVTFNAALPGALNGAGSQLLCNASSPTVNPGSVAQVTLTTSTNTVTVSNAKQFFIGESVMFYDASYATPYFLVSTVTGVDTTQNKIFIANTPSSALTTAATVQWTPTGVEYGFRPATTSGNPFTLDVNLSSGSATITYDASLASSSVMVGDQVLIDADGLWRTVADRAQATVTSVVVNGTSSTYQVGVTINAGSPAINTLYHGTSTVWYLGDSFTVTGATDTTGNSGPGQYRDQFSLCSSTISACNASGFLYY